jgi:hypothetical protein
LGGVLWVKEVELQTKLVPEQDLKRGNEYEIEKHKKWSKNAY